jgi:spermidine synthase
MNALGKHILVEFLGCSAEVLNDVNLVEQLMTTAAVKSGATVIQSSFHHFSPFGVSGVVVIQESHLAIHTWPEYQYAAVDLFTCGDSVDPWISFDFLKKNFKAQNQSAIEMHRGSLNLLNRTEFTFSENTQTPVSPQQSYTKSMWFTDKDKDQAVSLRYTKNTLYDQRSEFQRVRIFETAAHGKMLAINNMVMATEKDEAHYHEMIVHPALLAHPNPKNILIIGGGDGGTAREVLKHKTIEKVTMVEIDQLVIDACREFLPQMSTSFSNPKLDLKIQDGIAFVKDLVGSSTKFDVIIVDGSDPVGPAEGLFTHSFYRDCFEILNPDGVLVAQGESPTFNSTVFKELNGCLKEIFGPKETHVLLFYATTYPSGMWSFQISTKGKTRLLDQKTLDRSDLFCREFKMHYYNSGLHRAAFQLPQFVQELIS